MSNKIYVTRKLPEKIMKRLNKHFHVRMWESEETPVPREILLEEVQDVDGILCLLTDQIDEEVIEAAQKVKIISNLAVGFNNINVDLSYKRGITVTNTPDVLTETTADLTFALMLATSRRLMETSNTLRKGEWGAWSPMQFTGKDVFGATLGIIGLGRIGEAVVKRAKGFDMEVLYYNRTRKTEKEAELGISYREFDEILEEVDILTLLIPHSPRVHHLISKKELLLMRKEAILINTARGGLVDEKALYQALKNDEIWAAGLDVFEQEPLPTDHPLLTLPNVTTSPHIGSASINTRTNMCHLAADNLINVLNGRDALTPVKNNILPDY